MKHTLPVDKWEEISSNMLYIFINMIANGYNLNISQWNTFLVWFGLLDILESQANFINPLESTFIIKREREETLSICLSREIYTKRFTKKEPYKSPCRENSTLKRGGTLLISK